MSHRLAEQITSLLLRHPMSSYLSSVDLSDRGSPPIMMRQSPWSYLLRLSYTSVRSYRTAMASWRRAMLRCSESQFVGGV